MRQTALVSTAPARQESPSAHGAADRTTGSQRAWRLQVMAALAAQGGSVLIMVFVTLLGHADPRAVALWAPLSLAFSLGVLLALDRGWTRHLKDPTLTEAQIAYSIGSTALCYAMAGPLRAIALPMVCLGLIFSIFALPARRVALLTAYTLVLYALVMAAMQDIQPERYPWRDELVIYALLLVALPPLALLAMRMSELRTRLGRQRAELARALERIQDMAMRDELTGLLNRRSMNDELRKAELAARSSGRGFCVALIDLDHFKRVNDEHGHAMGDAVLRAFAQAAHAAVLGSDRLARWGGEEFIVLFDDAATAQAVAGARRVLESAAAVRLALPAGGALGFTVSIGLTVYEPGESFEATVERADRALYAAKAAGRNRLLIG
jgi:diguanylate cyclase